MELPYPVAKLHLNGMFDGRPTAGMFGGRRAVRCRTDGRKKPRYAGTSPPLLSN
jgi:hypothetical protein